VKDPFVSCRRAGSSEREDVYEWVREYDYRVHPQSEQEQSYWFAFGEHAVTYQHLNNRIHTQRNSKHKATPGFYRPVEVGLGTVRSSPALAQCFLA
jgi:hypothetical protein